MFKVLKNSWALFTGIGIMMIAHGLQGNLMAVRSVLENFNDGINYSKIKREVNNNHIKFFSKSLFLYSSGNV